MVRETSSPAFLVVSARDIAERAYEIYSARGRIDGFDRDDWLRAERELRTAPAVMTAKDPANVKRTATRRQL